MPTGLNGAATAPLELPLELWGGLECTVVRLERDRRDQLRETGQWDRAEDLDAVARLGLRTMRFPILWEHVAPIRPDQCDWRWHDARLGQMRALGIRPIAGLVHHGSGPDYTGLLDPGFAAGAAAHAARAAARYPWITDWTPINEPVTTARFSGLYGHWYPHRQDLHAFCHMVVHQCLAVLLSMRAIRRTVPQARLVQTEDCGRVFATPALRDQADHENDRNWLSLDLLCGRVRPSHPLWRLLIDAGVDMAVLDLLASGEATPDLVGINHYLTSDRYLDEECDRYPPQFAGGNGRVCYADVEAVRIVPPPGPVGPAARMRDVWARYGLPMAITEVHHGCIDPEQPVRWFGEIWHAAVAAQASGIDMRAVTLWSLFGAMDWRSLLTERAGAYDPGLWDTTRLPPAPTRLAAAVATLIETGQLPAEAARPGWWRHPGRVYLPPVREAAE